MQAGAGSGLVEAPGREALPCAESQVVRPLQPGEGAHPQQEYTAAAQNSPAFRQGVSQVHAVLIVDIQSDNGRATGRRQRQMVQIRSPSGRAWPAPAGEARSNAKRMQIAARNQPLGKTLVQLGQESARAAADFQQRPCRQGDAIQQGMADPPHARRPPMAWRQPGKAQAADNPPLPCTCTWLGLPASGAVLIRTPPSIHQTPIFVAPICMTPRRKRLARLPAGSGHQA